MAGDAESTKTALIRGGSHWFARDGIDGARIADIIQSAGQGNPSAINYHFGSRWGLLRAIVVDQLQQVDASIEPTGEGLAARVEAVVAPLAERLSTDDGRNFLRITNQLFDRTMADGQFPPDYLKGTLLFLQIEQLEASLPGGTAERRHDRLFTLLLFLASGLAWRARRIDSGEVDADDSEEFVRDLIAMLTVAGSCP